MTLDLRTAIAWMLFAIGFQLTAYGAMSTGRAASMNLQWGIIIAAAGGVFFLLARNGGRR